MGQCKSRPINPAAFILVSMILILTVFAAPGHAKNGTPHRKSQSSLVIPLRDTIEPDSVVVATNRWQPEKCMWVVKKEALSQTGTTIIFPFEELYNAVCHILVGVSDTHYCFIHLTPLTSFFRRDTSELEKILSNLQDMTTKKQKWSFTVYNFADNGREIKFRNVIARVLKNSPLEFVELIPDNYSGGELNLLFTDSMLTYSVSNLHRNPQRDASAKVIFNRIPIAAFE